MTAWEHRHTAGRGPREVPRFGATVGPPAPMDVRELVDLRGRPWALRLRGPRRWSTLLLVQRDLIATLQLTDLGHALTAAVAVVDVRDRRVLGDAGAVALPSPLSRVGPHLMSEVLGRFWSPGLRFGLEQGPRPGELSLRVELGPLPRLERTLRLRATLVAMEDPATLTVVTPPSEGGLLQILQKRSGLVGLGQLNAQGRIYGLDGALGVMEHGQGLLGRHRVRRAALGVGRLPDGTPVSLALAEGEDESREETLENVAWVGGEAIRLGRARFAFDRREPLDPWTVRTVDGDLELRLRPVHVQHERHQLGWARSARIRPMGRMEGFLRRGDERLALDLLGFAEDHDALW